MFEDGCTVRSMDGEPIHHPPGPVPRDGDIHVLVHFSRRFASRHGQPESITDHRGRRWIVVAVESFWQSQEYAANGQARPFGTVGAKWLLRVEGPLPGGGHGVGWVELRTYGDGAGFWLAPSEPPAAET